ncbi:MAG: ABC transporter permease [Actinobacteria bacterium]|nr:ABC transporter permease [Actinomycetota bacterium]
MTETLESTADTGTTLHEPRGTLHDSWVIARRGLIHMRRQPEQLSDATIQPVMFVLMFGFVFGGAIKPPGGGSYREFLMGGIFAQTLAFATFGVALSIANDRKNEIVDRFRSLPIGRGTVLGGYALANFIKATLPVVLMTITGLAIGWRIRAGLVHAVEAYALMLAFVFAMIWIGILLGSLVQTPEGVNGIAFAVLFPATFVASTFVPPESMPGVLRVVAQWNPISTLADSLRHLFGNPASVPTANSPWPVVHPIPYTVGWIVAITVACAPFAVRAYRRSLDD